MTKDDSGQSGHLDLGHARQLRLGECPDTRLRIGDVAAGLRRHLRNHCRNRVVAESEVLRLPIVESARIVPYGLIATLGNSVDDLGDNVRHVVIGTADSSGGRSWSGGLCRALEVADHRSANPVPWA